MRAPAKLSFAFILAPFSLCSNFMLGVILACDWQPPPSADTPLAVKIGRSALDLLEVVPGVTVREVLATGFPEGFDGNLQIGRTPPLSSNKSATHFPFLRRETGVPYDRMLFFDDCNWGDHCAAVANGCREVESGQGPVTVRTPHGLQVTDWENGMLAYARRRQS